MSEYIPIIIALIAGPVVAYITARLSRPKVRADAALSEAEASSVYTETALKLIEPLKRQIEELQRDLALVRAELSELRDENNALHRWAKLLYTQVIEAGETPYTFEESERLYRDSVHRGNKKP